MNPSEHIVPQAPPCVRYIPNYVSDDEAEHLWSQIYAAPKPKWTALRDRRLQNWGGTQTSKGMLMEPLPKWLQPVALKLHKEGFFESLTPNHVLVNEYLSGQGIMPHEDGPFFSPTIATITLGSHCVIHFYSHLRDATEQDEEEPPRLPPADESSDAHASSIFRLLDKRRVASLFLEKNSLVVLTQDMYTKYLHGIEPVKEDGVDTVLQACANAGACPSLRVHATSDGGGGGGGSDKALQQTLPRGTRVSLTIRHAPGGIKLPIKLGGK